MKLWPFFTIVNLLILVLSGTTHAVGDFHPSKQLYIPNRLTSNDLREITHVPNLRFPRAVLGTAVAALIRNAKEVQTSSTKYRKLLKRGTLQDAFDDFKMLKSSPDFKESYGMKNAIQFFVGDTELRFQIRRRWPTMLIYPKDTDAIKLIYIDRKELY